MTDDIKRIQVAPDLLDRWQLIAEQLGEHGAGLRLRLHEIEAGTNTSYALSKVATSARAAEKSASGQVKDLAGTLADEIECLAES